MALKRVHNVIATTQPIAAYSGIQLSEGAAESMATQLRSGSVPMTLNHNANHPLTATSVDAGTERRDDGYLNVWVEFDIPEADWEDALAIIQRDGAPGGFSFTTTEPLSGSENALIEVAADAHHFTDEQIEAAASAFDQLGSTRSERAYQFSFIPEAAVFVTFAASVVAEVPSHVLAAMIVDSLKRFVRVGRESTFTFGLRLRDGRTSAKIRIAADNPDAFKAAVERVPDVLRAALDADHSDPDAT
jgi:hypothetical protein